jgi:hypothetical protein
VSVALLAQHATLTRRIVLSPVTCMAVLYSECVYVALLAQHATLTRRVMLSPVTCMAVLYSECVSVALLAQHATLTRRIMLSPATCMAVLYFSTLSHKSHDFRVEKFIELKVRVLIFSTNLSQTLSFQEELREISS